MKFLIGFMCLLLPFGILATVAPGIMWPLTAVLTALTVLAALVAGLLQWWEPDRKGLVALVLVVGLSVSGVSCFAAWAADRAAGCRAEAGDYWDEYISNLPIHADRQEYIDSQDC